MQVQSDAKPYDDINITPMVDVVLVLLIIFMVVTPLLTKQFWLNLPKDDKSDVAPPPLRDADQPVVLTVDAQGTIRVVVQADGVEVADEQRERRPGVEPPVDRQLERARVR